MALSHQPLALKASRQVGRFQLCTSLVSLHPVTHNTVCVCSSRTLQSTSAWQPREVAMTCIPQEASGNSLTNSTQGGIPPLPLGLLFHNWWLMEQHCSTTQGLKHMHDVYREGMSVPQPTCGSQRTTWWSWFFPSMFTWASSINSGLYNKCFIH